LISERTKDVLQYRASQGLFNGGYPRLGFDLKDNRLIVISKEAAIVKEIFKVYLQRGSQSKTAIYLNDNGYRMKVWTTQKGVARGGNKFSKSNLSRILRDPAYIGKVKHKGQTFDAGHEAIVDVDTFNAVQSMIDSNIVTKTGFRESGNKCLLRGLVFCGACKSAMYLASQFPRARNISITGARRTTTRVRRIVTLERKCKATRGSCCWGVETHHRNTRNYRWDY